MQILWLSISESKWEKFSNHQPGLTSYALLLRKFKILVWIGGSSDILQQKKVLKENYKNVTKLIIKDLSVDWVNTLSKKSFWKISKAITKKATNEWEKNTRQLKRKQAKWNWGETDVSTLPGRI